VCSYGLETLRGAIARNFGENFAILDVFAVDQFIIIGNYVTQIAVVKDTGGKNVPVRNGIPLEVGEEIEQFTTNLFDFRVTEVLCAIFTS
jgi:hypothetical protein